jgi:DNA polymerase III subunit epsilon
MDFVAIDFETANHRPNSACQLAAVVVRQSQIVAEKSWLIRPPANQFSRFNIAVHGIRPADVSNSPTMELIWPEVQAILGQQLLIAHNARFDMGVLLASLSQYDVACDDFEFHCTRQLARTAWPGRTKYGLKPLGTWLGISFKHHDALEDARCCAKIALAIEAAGDLVGENIELLEKRLGVRRGRYRNGRLVSPRRSGQAAEPVQHMDRWGFPVPTTAKPAGSVCPRSVREACADQPLLGKQIVLIGPLRGMSLEETVALLTELGATVQASIDSSTSYVVTPGISISAAQQQVDRFQIENQASIVGKTIRVLSERQFRALLPGGAISLEQ